VPRDGNLLLDGLFGATMHFDGADHYSGVEGAIDALAARLRGEGRTPYPIPVGGASTLGVVAYARAVDELRGQVDTDPEWIVVADGSGGTHAGLLAGLGGTSPTRVLGVDVGTRPDLDEAVPRLAADAAGADGRDAPGASVVDHDHVGPGYGELSAACLDALRVTARTEGLVLDPVYSGKAMAALVTALRERRIGDGDTVVFWATGGAPALFAARYAALLTGD
jgi:1-aminocyclopropane-1-carboxylate deaminase/D-cysteine desulfhydrase-like pyridoxal-dependent ACC family enzyme